MRVVVVSGMCATHDAISGAVADHVELLSSLPEVESVTLITQFASRTVAAPVAIVHHPGQLLDHSAFRSADVALFHWGIYYPLFDALCLDRAGGPRAVAVFHNCTPIELVGPEQRGIAARSIQQAQLMGRDDIDVATYSRFNRATLEEWGIADSTILDLPFRIQAPRPLNARRSPDRLELLTVGRFVPAKGQLTLVEAVALLPAELRRRVRVRLAGNGALSDAAYMKELAACAESLGIRDRVRFVGEPNDDGLWQLYESSDAVVSTSLHEGLCVPVIEGYLAGCRAIGTTAGNLPYLVEPPDRVVEPNDPAALADAIAELDHRRRGGWLDTSAADRLNVRFGTESVRGALRRVLDTAMRTKH